MASRCSSSRLWPARSQRPITRARAPSTSSPRPSARVASAGAGHHYELTGLVVPPDPAMVARLAAWCADRGLLITELRLGSASLEERYLELVGADAAAEAEVGA